MDPTLFRALRNRQVTNAPTCQSSWTWLHNSMGQNPCVVGALLSGVCSGSDVSPGPLPSGDIYLGPPAMQYSNPCDCSTVVYNLMCACGACQGDRWAPWSTWAANCTTGDITLGGFPKPVPSGTIVPPWAYIDTSVSGSWNEQVAASETATSTASSTSAASSSSTSPTSSPSPSASSSPSSSPPLGAIIGAAVGGVALIALAIGIFLFVRHRRRLSRTHVDATDAFSVMLDSLPPSPKPYTLQMRETEDDPSVMLLPGSSSGMGTTLYDQTRTGGGRSGKGSRVDVSSTSAGGETSEDMWSVSREEDMRTPAPPYRPPTARMTPGPERR